MYKNRRFPKLRVPKLAVVWRIVLYVGMFMASIVALYQVATERLPFAAGIASYVLAALTIFPGIYYFVVDLIQIIKKVRVYWNLKIESNPYASKVSQDARLKTVVFAVPGAVLSILFAFFNGITGVLSHSAWFGCLSAYYLLLAVMRIGAVKREKEISLLQDETMRMEREDAIYRRNSILFIFLAIVLAGLVVLLSHSIGGKEYPGIAIYVAAMYTFYRIIMTFIHLVQDRKQNSPLVTIILKINYIDAWVSILTLQTAMFAAFGSEEKELISLMNALTGTAVCLIVLIAGIQGIIVSNKRRKRTKNSKKQEEES